MITILIGENWGLSNLRWDLELGTRGHRVHAAIGHKAMKYFLGYRVAGIMLAGWLARSLSLRLLVRLHFDISVFLYAYSSFCGALTQWIISWR